MMKLYIAPPLRMSDWSLEQPATAQRYEAIAVELEDPAPIVEYLHALKQQCALENVEVHGVTLNSRAYFSLREWLQSRAWYKAAEGVETIEFDGMRVFMDPMRDDGEPVPLFEEREAVRLYGLRRRPPAPDGAEGR